MEDLSASRSPNMCSASQNEREDMILHNNCKTNNGLICCICRKPPLHSKTYYAHVFCTDCFYKYIFTQSKYDCSGDIKNNEKATKEDQKEINDDEKEAMEDTVDVPEE